MRLQRAQPTCPVADPSYLDARPPCLGPRAKSPPALQPPRCCMSLRRPVLVRHAHLARLNCCCHLLRGSRCPRPSIIRSRTSLACRRRVGCQCPSRFRSQARGRADRRYCCRRCCLRRCLRCCHDGTRVSVLLSRARRAHLLTSSSLKRSLRRRQARRRPPCLPSQLRMPASRRSCTMRPLAAPLRDRAQTRAARPSARIAYCSLPSPPVRPIVAGTRSCPNLDRTLSCKLLERGVNRKGRGFHRRSRHPDRHRPRATRTGRGLRRTEPKHLRAAPQAPRGLAQSDHGGADLLAARTHTKSQHANYTYKTHTYKL